MKRNEISPKYIWRLEDIYATNEEWEKEYSRTNNSYASIEVFKGHLKQRETLLNCLRLMSELDLAISRLFAYAHMRKDQDGRDDFYSGMMDRTENLYNKTSAACSFITSEISTLTPEYLNTIIADPEFKDYDFMIEEVIRVKKHILTDKEEKILAMSGKALRGCSNAFSALTNVDLPRPVLKLDGKRQKLTQGLYNFYLFSEDRAARKTVFRANYGAYKSMINTIAALYGGNVNADNFYAKAKGFNGCLEQALFFDDIPKAVYENLIKTVKANQKTMHSYVALRKDALGLSTMHMYDMYVSLVKGMNLSLSYEDAYELVIKGLSPMGEEYKQLLTDARDNGWIDVCENEGKRGGAYCSGVYGVHPYVLLNYTKTSHDVFTIAHELGHAMHSFYSNKNQPYPKHNYQIFVAEVASTVNEVLLLKYLISTAKDKQTKAYLLNYYLDMFRTTLFRQTMLAEFEMVAHEMDLKGQPLTVQSLSDKYYQLNKKYYGKAVRHDDEIRYEWARIPHFYNAFYVYKYATGLTSAINIAKKLLADPSFVKTYKENFLCAGGYDSAYNILKSTGVDLATPAPFEVAMEEFQNTLEELKKELE